MEDIVTLGFRLNVGFIHATWGVEYRDGYQINCLNINNWNYAANALDYWTLNVIYITLGVLGWLLERNDGDNSPSWKGSS
jgi:hypothetical protein